ncbi:g7718 [Coccomyxa elongata]
MERFFKAQIQAGMLEKARQNAAQTWTVMAATAATELLRRFQPLARPPSFPAIDAFPALRKEAHAKFTSMEESATGKAWGLLLCRMGGIGKTTLAKAMYSLLSERIPDARVAWVSVERPQAAEEHSRDCTASLIEKQQQIHEQLLHDTDSPSMNPVNLEDGRLQLASRLKDQKIALFIDDVWGRELSDILPDNLLSIIAPGSCVIITSRSDDYVLPGCAVHDLAFLPSSQALRVFCHHAGIDLFDMKMTLGESNNVHLPEEQIVWTKLILTVVSKCSGLPLSLEITAKCLGLTLRPHDFKAGSLPEALTLQQICQLTDIPGRNFARQVGTCGGFDNQAPGVEEFDLQWPPSLETVHLEDCPRLATLQEKLSSQPVHGPRTLSLVKCPVVKQLPCITLLIKLQELSVKECHSFKELPRGINCLSSLQKLELTGCSSLRQLPSNVGGLTSLQELSITGCTSLQKVPEEIGALTGLTLYLDGCTSLNLEKLPSSIKALVYCPISPAARAFASIRRFDLVKMFSSRKQRRATTNKRAGWFTFSDWRVWR